MKDQGNGNVKRNLGLARSSQPFVLCVDDDSILRPECIAKMLAALEASPEISFVYCDYVRIILPGVDCPAPSGRFSAGSFSIPRLRAGNYINTTSLVRRMSCAKWDEGILRFQDWDFWLSVVLAGGVGKYIPEVLYELWQIDQSVSSCVPAHPYFEMIVAKHRLKERRKPR